MKKILLLAASIMLACSSLSAQQSSEFNYSGAARPDFNEISLSYGYFTLNHLANSFGGILGAVIVAPLSDETFSNCNSTGFIGLEYMRYLNSGRFAFGGLVGYEGIESSFKNKKTEDIRKVGETLITVMPTAKVMWFNRAHVGMYSRAGVGVSVALVPDKAANCSLALQVSPVGVDFGGKAVRGFVEAGFGTQGVISAGIKTCF
ncbi:MAG: hypothetical protein MJY91_01805 [Bacteroidales bacterium]|nr:hypothetical protein [Bacteroidales bacterium]